MLKKKTFLQCLNKIQRDYWTITLTLTHVYTKEQCELKLSILNKQS